MKIEDINKIYNKFPPEGRNMSRVEFIREMQELTSSKKITEDLADIELQKARQRSNRIRIDRALEKPE